MAPSTLAPVSEDPRTPQKLSRPLLLQQDQVHDLPVLSQEKPTQPRRLPIQRRGSSMIIVIDPVVKSDEEEVEMEPSLFKEAIELMLLVYPIAITYVLEYIPGVVCIVLVGHIDSPDTKIYVDAAALSNTWMNVSALSIGYGLSSALDTLCSQAFGAQEHKKIGLYFQAGAIVISACLLPVFLLNWYTESILLFLGQDADVARYAGEFSRYTVFGMPFLFAYEMVRNVMQAQNIVHPFIFTTIAGNCVSIFGGYYLTYYTSMGFHGAALALMLGNITLSLVLVPFFIIKPSYRDWWNGWNLAEAWSNVPTFLKLGVPGMLMMAMEWWAYEIMTVMAGVLPNAVVSVSTHAVLTNVASLLYVVFLAVSVGCSIRVGNYMGAEKPKHAQLTSKISLVLVICIGLVFSSLIYGLRHQIPTLLINDSVSIEHAARALLVLVPYELIDGVNGVMQGIYRGVGKQDFAAKVNGIAFYAVGISLSAFMAFVFNWGVEGLWIGFGLGTVTAFVVCSTVLFRANWQTMVVEARDRLEI